MYRELLHLTEWVKFTRCHMKLDFIGTHVYEAMLNFKIEMECLYNINNLLFLIAIKCEKLLGKAQHYVRLLKVTKNIFFFFDKSKIQVAFSFEFYLVIKISSLVNLPQGRWKYFIVFDLDFFNHLSGSLWCLYLLCFNEIFVNTYLLGKCENFMFEFYLLIYFNMASCQSNMGCKSFFMTFKICKMFELRKYFKYVLPTSTTDKIL